jgi:hypothetical protein
VGIGELFGIRKTIGNSRGDSFPASFSANFVTCAWSGEVLPSPHICPEDIVVVELALCAEEVTERRLVSLEGCHRASAEMGRNQREELSADQKQELRWDGEQSGWALRTNAKFVSGMKADDGIE